jgi:hypothetical protein
MGRKYNAAHAYTSVNLNNKKDHFINIVLNFGFRHDRMSKEVISQYLLIVHSGKDYWEDTPIWKSGLQQ